MATYFSSLRPRSTLSRPIEMPGWIHSVFKPIFGCQRRKDASANEHSAFWGDGVFKPFLVSVLHRIVALFKRLWNWQISMAMHENCQKGSLWCAFALQEPVYISWPGKPRNKRKGPSHGRAIALHGGRWQGSETALISQVSLEKQERTVKMRQLDGPKRRRMHW